MKVTGKFTKWAAKAAFSGWNFGDWDRWRREDGMLCRTDEDCSWLDPGLQCQGYELTWTPSPQWFGGGATIAGACECGGTYNMDWSKDIECKVS